MHIFPVNIGFAVKIKNHFSFLTPWQRQGFFDVECMQKHFPSYVNLHIEIHILC